MGESQSPQGFGETVTTVTTVTTVPTEFVARSKISACGHERSAFDGSTSKTVVTGGDGGDSHEPRGIPLSPPPKSPVVTVGRAASLDRATIVPAHVECAPTSITRRVVLHEWVEAAGGRHDAVAIYIPAALPNGLALATLKAHARALGLNVRSDPDDPG